MSYLYRYMDDDRQYHTFEHVGKMFEDLRTYFPEYRKNKILKFAILYHDCHYSPGFSLNEQTSAEALAIEVGENLNTGEIKEAYRLIMLTKDHKAVSGDNLGGVMIDLDLARLASEDYFTNSKLIREEFNDFSDEQWRSGRVTWLESFMSRDYIFQTNVGRANFERPARNRMQLELDYLKGLKE